MKNICIIWQKIMVYTLIGIYTFALIRPIIPVAKDMIAHIFFEIDHIATVHYENGKYHVHKELLKNGEQPQTTNDAERSAFSELLFNHLQNTLVQIPVVYASGLLKEKPPLISFPVDLYFPPNSPPPKA